MTASDDNPATPARTRGARIWRMCLACLGVLLLILSVPVAILTPFPFVPVGLSVGITGAALLARNSARGRLWLTGRIIRYPKLGKLAPQWLHVLLLGEEDITGKFRD